MHTGNDYMIYKYLYNNFSVESPTTGAVAGLCISKAKVSQKGKAEFRLSGSSDVSSNHG